MTQFNTILLGESKRGMLSINRKNCHATQKIDIRLKNWKYALLIEFDILNSANFNHIQVYINWPSIGVYVYI